MFSAPYRDLQRAVERGQIGDLNPTPWAFMLGNCFGWVVYAILTQNLFIFWGNAPGFLLSVYLNLGAVKLLYQRHHATEMRKSFVAFLKQEEETKQEQSKRDLEVSTRMRISEPPVASTTTTAKDWATVVWNVTSQTTPAPAPHETLVLVIVTIWTICMSILGFTESFDAKTRELIVGTLVNLNLVFFYGAPLSTIYSVLTQGNSSSIHIRTVITNTLNGTFWMAYGLAVLDPIVYVPNGLGAFLGVTQIVLIVVYPRRASVAEEGEGYIPYTTLPLTHKTASTLGLDLMEVEANDTAINAPILPSTSLENGGVPMAASTDGSSSADAETSPPLEP